MDKWGKKAKLNKHSTYLKGGVLIKSTNSEIEMTWCADGGISQKNLLTYLHMLNETLSHKCHPYSILIG
jgi:hypothetical protein